MRRQQASVEKSGTEPQPVPVELRRLWFAALRREWSSLVVVPAHPGGSALQVAEALVQIGGIHGSRPVRLLDARTLVLKEAAKLVVEMSSWAAAGEVVIVVVDSVVWSETGIPLLLAADAALLCVTLGESDFDSAKRTIELVGRERFLGSVVLDRSAAG